MIKKTLYFSNPAYLSLKQGQIVIKLPEIEKAGNVADIIKQQSIMTKPIEDIGILILDNRQITLTHALLNALLDNNSAVVTCNDKNMPTGLLLPLAGNSIQTERFTSQIEASAPLKKQLWQQTVKAKIENQAKVLSACSNVEIRGMMKWATDVKSGDADNLEARAAVFYWKNIFSPFTDYKFTRDRNGIPPNNLLNYGYAILRAVIARAIVGSGLLPTFGIHHHNRYNAYCLADDIMEPYRPYVDELVFSIVKKYGMENLSLTKHLKIELLNIPTIDVTIGGKKSPLMVAASQTSASLAKCFNGEIRKISYPAR